MDNKVLVASTKGAYSVVCHSCKLWRGVLCDDDERKRDLQALLESFRHVLESHFAQQMVVVCASVWAVEAVLSTDVPDAELANLLQLVRTLYRSLPHCNIRKMDSMDPKEAVEWARMTARMR